MWAESEKESPSILRTPQRDDHHAISGERDGRITQKALLLWLRLWGNPRTRTGAWDVLACVREKERETDQGQTRRKEIIQFYPLDLSIDLDGQPLALLNLAAYLRVNWPSERSQIVTFTLARPLKAFESGGVRRQRECKSGGATSRTTASLPLSILHASNQCCSETFPESMSGGARELFKLVQYRDILSLSESGSSCQT